MTRDRLVTPVGLVVWVLALLLVPAPLAARILMLAPLVIVPRLLAVMPERRWVGPLAGWPSLVAALPLLLAFSLPAGPVAATLTVPWLACAAVGLAASIRHGLLGFPSILRPGRVPELGVDVALGFWALGAGFLVVERLGFDTGFPPLIDLLTATHFHFAGLGLLTVACLLAATRRWVRWPVAGLMLGIPLTALGFQLGSDLVSAAGAVVVGTAGLGVAIAMLATREAGIRGWGRGAAGLALLVGMPLGIAWSIAVLADVTFIDLDAMVRTHGALNATAVVFATLSFRPAR